MAKMAKHIILPEESGDIRLKDLAEIIAEINGKKVVLSYQMRQKRWL